MAASVQANLPRVGAGTGLVAGLIGGIAMAMVVMLVSAVMGMGFWAMPQMISGLVLGSQAAMAGGATAILVGLVVHMMLSAVYGLIYAWIVNAVTHEFWLTGIAFGIVLWVVNFYGFGSFWPAAAMMQKEPLMLAIVSHAIFGLVTAGVAVGFAGGQPRVRTA